MAATKNFFHIISVTDFKDRLTQSIQMVFIFVNSLIPSIDSSRPKPDFLIPPKGSLGSDFTMALIKTAPSSASFNKHVRCTLRLGKYLHSQSEFRLVG